MNRYQKTRYLRIFKESFVVDRKLYKINQFIVYIHRDDAKTKPRSVVTIDLFLGKLSCTCSDFIKNSIKKKCLCRHCCFILFDYLKCFTADMHGQDIRTSIGDHTLFFQFLQFNNIEKTILRSIFNDPALDFYNKFNIDNKCHNPVDYDCCICLDSLHNHNANIKCPDCRNVFHKLCMKKWTKINKTCVTCRSSKWSWF